MAIEIANIVHAIALVDLTTPSAPVLLAGDGFEATVTQVSTGIYRLTTTLSLDFGEGLPLASVPAAGASAPTFNARIVSDGVIEVVFTNLGTLVDPPYFLVLVLRYRSGEIPAPVLAPPAPSPASKFSKGYAVIESDGTIFVQQGGWIDTLNHTGPGVYEINLLLPFQGGQNSALATLWTLAAGMIAAQATLSTQITVNTYDAAGTPADRFFTVELLGPP